MKIRIDITLLILLIVSIVLQFTMGGNSQVRLMADNTLQVGLTILDKLSGNINSIVLTLINCYTLSRLIKNDKDKEGK